MAGIGYFNEVFNIFHDGYEDWAQAVCGSKDEWFANPEWAVPIKKLEAEYFTPLIAFRSYTLRISLNSTGTSSFTLKSQILDKEHICCEIISAHVFMHKESRRSMAIPAEIQARLKSTP